MKFSILTISSFALGLFLFSCNNDTINDNSGDACEFVVCEDGEQCKNGECVDNSNLCDATLNICIDEITIKQCVLGEIPRTVQCSLTEQCKDGECIPRAADEKCTLTSSSCINETTVKECSEGSDPYIYQCEAEKICRNGKCTAKPGKIGEECKDRDCEDGAFCSLDEICEKFIPLGEACIFLETFCEVPYECINNLCQRKLELGDDCGEFDFCSGGVCHNGKCTKVSEHYDDCDLEKPCATGAVCIDGKCIPTKGDCNHKDECTGDSYCCLEASCAPNQNKCVPYSNENPNDTTCSFETKPGIFEASVQCFWEPTQSASSRSSYNTVVSGLFRNKEGTKKPSLAFISFSPLLVRIIDSETCQEIEDIPVPQGYSYNNLAAADFTGDGYMEIVTISPNPVLIKWDTALQQHTVTAILNQTLNVGGISNGSLAIHDIDNDGIPEIIGNNGVVFRADGTLLNSTALPMGQYTSPNLGDFNGDGVVEMQIGGRVYKWDKAGSKWDLIADLSSLHGQAQGAYADFGTPGSSPASFNFENLDGVAELVLALGSTLEIWSIFDKNGQLTNPQKIYSYSFPISQHWGYPPAIGDFNGDGLPEIGVASKSSFGVYDPKCKQAEAGKCSRIGVSWESVTQDGSGIAGATAFDFDGDGKIEIVYGDECFTRVYDGQTGEVLFSSPRSSGTVIEYPIIADVDNDGSTEIVVASDHGTSCPALDSSHNGVKCTEDSDCYSKSCIDGRCRCTHNNDCNWQTINGRLYEQYSCSAPTPNDEKGNVCRAGRRAQLQGVMVLRDRLDRWVSSRTIWNQHSYNITNINDDGSIPKTSNWKLNYKDPKLNNYRQQIQGATGAGFAPDITGRFTSSADVCKSDAEGKVLLKGQVCNRGTKAVGSKMPAVFYVDSIDAANILCVSYTDEMVPVGGCRMVDCEITQDKVELLKNKKIIMQVNDDGKGGKTTVECNEDNNTDEIFIESCMVN